MNYEYNYYLAYVITPMLFYNIGHYAASSGEMPKSKSIHWILFTYYILIVNTQITLLYKSFTTLKIQIGTYDNDGDNNVLNFYSSYLLWFSCFIGCPFNRKFILLMNKRFFNVLGDLLALTQLSFFLSDNR